jgi:hypothetical protein
VWLKNKCALVEGTSSEASGIRQRIPRMGIILLRGENKMPMHPVHPVLASCTELTVNTIFGWMEHVDLLQGIEESLCDFGTNA